MLSTSSSALFFTSYSYFAHSLSKVLDMLTSEEDSSSTAMKYTLLLVALNTCVWCSTILLWVVRFFSLPTADTIDDIAQFSLAVAALTTCMAFGVHFQRVYCFMKRYGHISNCLLFLYLSHLPAPLQLLSPYPLLCAFVYYYIHSSSTVFCLTTEFCQRDHK